MVEGGIVGELGARLVAGLDQVIESPPVHPPLEEVVRQHAVLLGQAGGGAALLQIFAHAHVQLAPPGKRQAAIGHLLGQVMLEGVLFRRLIHRQVHAHQVLQGGLQAAAQVAIWVDALEHGGAEIDPDDRGHLDHLARRRLQPVNAAHDQAGQRGGHIHRGLASGQVPGGLAQRIRLHVDGARLAQGTRHLAHEQRVALGALQDQALQGQRKRRLSQHRAHQLQADLVIQLGQVQGMVMLAAGPAHRLRRGTAQQHEQKRGGLDVARHVRDQLQRGAVGPVQVVQHQQQRLLGRLGQQKLQNHVEEALLAHLGVQRGGQRVLLHLQAQDAADDGRPIRKLSRRQHTQQARPALLQAGALRQAEQSIQRSHPRQVRDGLAVRDRLAAQREHALPARIVGHLGHQARFAHPGLAVQVQHSALAPHGSIHQAAHQRQLSLAADKAALARSRRGAPFGPAADQVIAHRLALALDADRRALLRFKQAADVPGGGLADQHLTLLGHAHQACRQVDLVAHHRIFLAQPRPQVACKNVAGVDAGALAQRKTPGRRFQPGKGLAGGLHLQRCGHGILRVVLVRHRRAKDDHQAVAHGVGIHFVDHAAVAANDLLHGSKMLVEQRRQGLDLLGAGLLDQLVNAVEIGKQHRHQAVLALDHHPPRRLDHALQDRRGQVGAERLQSLHQFGQRSRHGR